MKKSKRLAKNNETLSSKNRLNWDEIEKDYWKKFEKNNFNIALNVLYENKQEICLAYTSKYISVHMEMVGIILQ